MNRTKNEGRLNLVLKVLVAHDAMSGEEADRAKEAYLSLANSSAAKAEAEKYTNGERLDDLWLNKILKVDSSAELIKMVRNILVLSHGQATVESGFSINDATIVENQLEKTLIAYRRVYDHVLRLKVPVHELAISSGMMNAVKCSRSRYHSSLQKEKDVKSQRENEQEKERKRLREELIEKQEQQKKLRRESEALEKEINLLRQKRV